MLRLNFNDTQQQALAFLKNQLSIQEPGFYEQQYAEIQYPNLVPVATTGWEWAKSVTYMSVDTVGHAQWHHGQARDFPTADVSFNAFETTIHMASIGYRWNVEELANAQRLGVPLDTQKATAARRIAEEFIDDIVFRGDTEKNFEGLINQSTGVVQIDAASVGDQNGATNSPYWINKTGQQIMDDINTVLTDVYVDSRGIEVANTLLMPLEMLDLLSRTQFGTLNLTLLDWITQHNIVTHQTGQALEIRPIRGLETADDAGGGRVVAYRRDPGVLRFHMPMPHRFLQVWPLDPMNFFVPGILRIGGLDIRRPGAMRYLELVSAPPA